MANKNKRRRIPLLVIFSFAVLGLLTCGAVFAPWISPHDMNEINLLNRNAPPVFMGGSFEFFLGTDQLGRDTLTRCLHGLRVSMGITVVGLAIGSMIGLFLGLLSGQMGGWTDRCIMTLVDFQLSVPFLLIALLAITLFGTDLKVLIALIGLARWETYARLTRGMVLSLREQPFIESARAIGASPARILFRYILPHLGSTIVVLLTLNFPSVLMMESSLSFLGIGVQAPTPSIGRMVGESRNYLMTTWWVVMTPTTIILLIATMMKVIGDWLRDSFDVRFE